MIPPITTVPELHCHLQEAVELELSTIPPYLCATWTIADAADAAAVLIRNVAIAEMRHMVIAANVLIATGGTPTLAGVVPDYPTYLPDGEHEFEVSLLPFGPEFLQQAMWIEQPAPLQSASGSAAAAVASGEPIPRQHRVLALGHIDPTIGQFYAAIQEGIRTLVAAEGEAAIFPDGGRVGLQFPAFDNDTVSVAGSVQALDLITDIVEEGEGGGAAGTMWDEHGQLSHYYTFQEISLGRCYRLGDEPGCPTGPAIQVPAGAEVQPMLPNPKMSDYGPPSSPVWKAANAFNEEFGAILALLDLGFRGDPARVADAVGRMFDLPVSAQAVLAHEVPDRPGHVAGPTFQVPPYDHGTRS